MPGNNHYGNCTCGWCWGRGNSGRSSATRGMSASSSQSETLVGRTTSWGNEDDCCFLTTCRLCGGAVYFVRHNGGSVLFDSLGPPWPKHHCIPDDPVGKKLRTRLTEPLITTRVLLVGVCVETTVTHQTTGGEIIVAHGDREQLQEQIVSPSSTLLELPGCLMIVTLDDEGRSLYISGPEFVQRGIGMCKRPKEPES